MNTIKYLNPKTGERKRVRTLQPRGDSLERWKDMSWSQRQKNPRRLTMVEADAIMLKQGFVRA